MNLEAQNIFVFEISPIDALINLSFALLCGIIVAVAYRSTYRGVNFSANNVLAMIMLAMITALVIVVIGSNLARAFGLVGAMSIVRFRTAVKDTQDIMFIFFALAAGLACGSGLYLVALTGTIFIAIVTWLAVQIQSENPRKREYLLQVYVNTLNQDLAVLQNCIDENVRTSKLINVKSIGEDKKELNELTFYVTFGRRKRETKIIDSLKSLAFVERVNLYFDED
jgi:uncharacterized membrane protein YhiD involved in acid resistance